MSALIDVNGLRKRFGDIEALAAVSFHVAAGEIYGLRWQKARSTI